METIGLFEWEHEGKRYRLLHAGVETPDGATGFTESMFAGFRECAVELYKLKQAYEMVLQMVPDAVE